MQFRLIKISAALAVLFLASCASVSVEKMRHTIPPQEGPKTAPAEILIRPFAVSNEALRVDRDSEELEEFKKELRDRLANQMAERFKKHVANTRVAAEGDAASLATGDGANDIPMLVAASYGVAYRAKPKARAAANGSIDRGDLTDVLRLLGIPEADWV